MSPTTLLQSPEAGSSLKTVAPGFFRDTVAVAAGDYFAYSVNFILTILVNRAFGTLELGRFSLAVAISSVLILSTNNGFSAILKRDIAVDYSRASAYTGTFWTLRLLILVVLGSFVTLGGRFVMIQDRRTALIVMAVFIAKSIDSLGEICFGVYQAYSRMIFYSVARVAQFATLLGCCLVALFYFKSADVFYSAFVGVSAVFLLLNVACVRTVLGIVPKFSKDLLSYVFKESWPLIVNAFAYIAYARVGILSVGSLLGVEAAGIYTAGVNILSGLAMLPAACGVVLFPAMSRSFERDQGELVRLIRKATLMLAAAGLLITSVLLLVGPWLIRLYGKLPSNATETLHILALGLTAQFAAPVAGYAFTAIRRQTEGMLFAAGMLVVSAVIYILSIRAAGRTGAALAYVASQTLWTAGAYVLIMRRLLTPYRR
jgi:PST family polysaccharide transporter